MIAASAPAQTMLRTTQRQYPLSASSPKAVRVPAMSQ